MTKVNFHQKAIIFNEAEKILALKASYKGLLWDLPGGAVEIPENHEVALKREVKEETGLEIISIKPLTVSTGYNKEEDAYYLFIGYQVGSLEGRVVISTEHTEYRWVTPSEFLELDATPYLKDFVREFSQV